MADNLKASWGGKSEIKGTMAELRASTPSRYMRDVQGRGAYWTAYGQTYRKGEN